MFPSRSAASAAAVLAVGLGLPDYAHATTYMEQFDQTSGGSCCVVDNKNIVTVATTATAGVFLITSTLDTNWFFQKNDGTKLTGHAASFGFSSSATNFTLSLPVFNSTSGPFTGTERADTASYAMSPYNMPANGYLVSQNANNGVYNTLSFDVTTGFTTGVGPTADLTDLTSFLASLLSGTGGTPAPIFIADVQEAAGPTGTVGFTDQCGDVSGTSCGTTTTTSVTPLPAALPLFGTGLGALGLVGWRRKRNAAAIAA
jgi:hypothetical protein